MTKPLAYYDTELINVIKCFIVHVKVQLIYTENLYIKKFIISTPRFGVRRPSGQRRDGGDVPPADEKSRFQV